MADFLRVGRSLSVKYDLEENEKVVTKTQSLPNLKADASLEGIKREMEALKNIQGGSQKQILIGYEDLILKY